MSRNDIEDRIIYSHYLEKLYSTATGRLDKIISTLIIIFGSSIVLNGDPFLFGVLVVALSGIQTVYQPGNKSAVAKKRSFDYLRLFTNSERYNDDDLEFHLLELEASDENIWSSLETIAVLKAQIKLGVIDDSELKNLPAKLKVLRLLCG